MENFLITRLNSRDCCFIWSLICALVQWLLRGDSSIIPISAEIMTERETCHCTRWQGRLNVKSPNPKFGCFLVNLRFAELFQSSPVLSLIQQWQLNNLLMSWGRLGVGYSPNWCGLTQLSLICRTILLLRHRPERAWSVKFARCFLFDFIFILLTQLVPKWLDISSSYTSHFL